MRRSRERTIVSVFLHSQPIRGSLAAPTMMVEPYRSRVIRDPLHHYKLLSIAHVDVYENV